MDKPVSTRNLPSLTAFGATYLIARAQHIQGYEPSERFFQPDDGRGNLQYPRKNRAVFNELARARKTLPDRTLCPSTEDTLIAVKMHRVSQKNPDSLVNGQVLPGTSYTPETLRRYQTSLMPVANELAGYLYAHFKGAAAAVLPLELLNASAFLEYRNFANCPNIAALIDEHLSLPPTGGVQTEKGRIILPRRVGQGLEAA